VELAVGGLVVGRRRAVEIDIVERRAIGVGLLDLGRRHLGRNELERGDPRLHLEREPDQLEAGAALCVDVHDARADLRAAIRAHPVEPALGVGAGTSASAIARYYDIAAHRAGDEASRAFYSIAVVKHRLAQNADALDVLDAYSRRFVDGKEVRAVLWLRLRILCLDKIDDRCRAAAYTYLHDAPDGPAADIAHRITRTE
jgi:hypothetical protein